LPYIHIYLVYAGGIKVKW